MSRIRRLDPLVVNKIAAGEVIERPASVVKELLENAVDALATRIEVDVSRGGIESIRVVDDGEGMDADDLPLAVASHATSKLATADDLFRVHTLGFRGEALASIASVGHVRIRSRRHEADAGHELEVACGEAGDVQPSGGPVGTSIEVRRLFSSTPVRRKFLKTNATEFGHVGEQFTRVALAHPRLHAVLRHDGKVVHDLPAGDTLHDRLRRLFGRELAESLIWIESEADGVRLSGYVAHPGRTRSTRKGQHLFLNGRWIQDRALQHALTEAYRGLIMVGRHPIAFLYLDVPPELVDVNVHPTKTEVRFVDGQRLYRQLLSTLRSTFLNADLDGTMRVNGHGEPSANRNGHHELGPGDATPEAVAERQRELADWATSQLQAWQPDDRPVEGTLVAPRTLLAPAADSSALDPVNGYANGHSNGHAADGNGSNGHAVNGVEGSEHTAVAESEAASAGPVHTPAGAKVMQVHDAYLVVETDDGLTVIDQHALHERVMYEYLRKRVLDGDVETQRLLVPIVVDVAPKERELLLENVELLKSLGFEIDDFGGGSVAVNGYPVMLGRADLVSVVTDLAERLDSPGRAVERRDLLDELLHSMSCKAAVKAGDRLTPEEMDGLLRKRHLIEDAHHCPHGRPTALVLSKAELDRQFGRLG